MPGPYPNEEAARAGNGGNVDSLARWSSTDSVVVFPLIFPSLSRLDTEMPYVVRGSVRMVAYLQDYIYSLLTGYVDPPPGVAVAEGMNYNP
jgi:ubiquinol-cytochrome c reductase cytochrome c1 subunit